MTSIRGFIIAAVCLIGASPATAADRYVIDNEHASFTFKVSHLGISWVHGRFNEVEGEVIVDSADPSKSSCHLTIKVESIDTKVAKRDDHLRSPDFFAAKEFPLLTFKSTRVRPVDKGLEVTGEVTLHGRTKPMTVLLTGGKTAQYPPGVTRIGYSTDFILKRKEFGMDFMPEAIGNDVHVSASFEAIRQ